MYMVSKKEVRKILHDIVIVGSIQSTSQCTYYEVQLSIVHLIIKSELVHKVCKIMQVINIGQTKLFVIMYV